MARIIIYFYIVLPKIYIFERVEEFKYLGTDLTNQNSIAEEIKSRLRPGNACYHVFQFVIQKCKDQDM